MVVAFSGILRRKLVTADRGLVDGGGAEVRKVVAGSNRSASGRVRGERTVYVRRLYPPWPSDSCTVLLAVICRLLGEAAPAK